MRRRDAKRSDPGVPDLPPGVMPPAPPGMAKGGRELHAAAAVMADLASSPFKKVRGLLACCW